jgi:hypothetical protein
MSEDGNRSQQKASKTKTVGKNDYQKLNEDA